MELRVNDYVRTDTGIIQKIGKIYEQNETNDTHIQLNKMGTGKSVFILDNGKELSYSKGEVIKSSSNIIDLIEVGDIVNYGLIGGGMVLHKENDKITTNTLLFGILKNEDIKSVITKEQLKNCMYEVGE